MTTTIRRRRKTPEFPLTAEQAEALRDYKALVQHRFPRQDWTAILATDWLVAGPKASGFDRDRWHHLQRVRNVHGPECLPFLDSII